MKQGFLVVCLCLLLARSASAIFARIDQQMTTPNLLVFDIGWEVRAEQTVPGENSFLDQNGNLLWHVAIKDQSLAQRLIDVDVLMQDPLAPGTQVMDSWSFFYDEQRRFDRSGYWPLDQDQTGERIPPPPMEGVIATLTLLDSYSARVTYAVPEPSVLAFVALSGSLWAVHRRLK